MNFEEVHPHRPNNNATKIQRATRKGEQEWRSQRSNIEQLYIHGKHTLKDVIKLMQERHGFVASRRQYEYHLALWKACKYAPRTETSVDSTAGEDLTPSRHSVSSIFEVINLNGNLSAGSNPASSFSTNHQDLAPLMLQWFSYQSDSSSQRPLSNSIPNSLDVGSDPTLAVLTEGDFVDVDVDIEDMVYGQIESQPTVTNVQHSCAEHQWQVPKFLRRLWEIDTPVLDRDIDQQSRVQILVWCLWMCGNHICFSNFARRSERIVRVEDDVTRFEATIEMWMRNSFGYPIEDSLMINATPHAAHTSPVKYSSLHASHVSASLPHGGGIQAWRTHARFGYEFAMLNAAGRRDDTKKLRDRLHSDLTGMPGTVAFFISFARIIKMCQHYLRAEISNMRGLEPDVRDYVNSQFQNNASTIKPTNPSGEVEAVGILALLCYQRWSSDAEAQEFKSNMEAMLIDRTGFPIDKAFQWTIRLLLFHSRRSSGAQGFSVTNLAPISLCSKALNGLSALDLGLEKLPQPAKFSSDMLVIYRKVSRVWLRWLSKDSAFFLPPLQPSDVSPESGNLWQSGAASR